MHPQLQQIAGELNEATARLRRLADALPFERWRERPGPERWSVAEGVAHLNLTSQAFLPLIERGLDEARALGRRAPRRYRTGFIGGILLRLLAPPVRFRVKTGAAFVPGADATSADILREFQTLQDRLLALVAASDGLPIDRVRVVSPFDGRVSYNLFASFAIIAVHQHRHLWQAEQGIGGSADRRIGA